MTRVSHTLLQVPRRHFGLLKDVNHTRNRITWSDSGLQIPTFELCDSNNKCQENTCAFYYRKKCENRLSSRSPFLVDWLKSVLSSWGIYYSGTLGIYSDRIQRIQTRFVLCYTQDEEDDDDGYTLHSETCRCTKTPPQTWSILLLLCMYYYIIISDLQKSTGSSMYISYGIPSSVFRSSVSSLELLELWKFKSTGGVSLERSHQKT